MLNFPLEILKQVLLVTPTIVTDSYESIKEKVAEETKQSLDSTYTTFLRRWVLNLNPQAIITTEMDARVLESIAVAIIKESGSLSDLKNIINDCF
jgi:hypothetical protein